MTIHQKIPLARPPRTPVAHWFGVVSNLALFISIPVIAGYLSVTGLLNEGDNFGTRELLGLVSLGLVVYFIRLRMTLRRKEPSIFEDNEIVWAMSQDDGFKSRSDEGLKALQRRDLSSTTD